MIFMKKMRMWLVFWVVIFIMAGSWETAYASENSEIHTNIQLTSEVRNMSLDFILDESPYVGLRSLADALETCVIWDDERKAVVYAAGSVLVLMQEERRFIYVVHKFPDGEYELSRIELSTSPMVVSGGRTYVPVFILPALGMLGIWDEDFAILDIVLSPYVYKKPAPQFGLDEVWSLIEPYWEQDRPLREFLLGSFSTKFNAGEKDRTNNLKQAIAAIDGMIIESGGIFSFNDIVGPRTPERNYLKAIVYQDGKKVEDYGGGVCQVSSTIYNAARAAGMTIVERHPHGLPVTYVGAGDDATVYYGVLDFRFRNDSENSIVVNCRIDGNKLIIEIKSLL